MASAADGLQDSGLSSSGIHRDGQRDRETGDDEVDSVPVDEVIMRQGNRGDGAELDQLLADHDLKPARLQRVSKLIY